MSNKVKGIFCILISALFFALMSTFVKASGNLHFGQKALFRNLIALFVSIIIFYRSKAPLKIKFDDLKILFGRASIGTIGLLCNFYAVDRIVLADANMLNKLSPFFAILFSFLLLREKPNKMQITAVAIAFIGAMLIIKPGFGFNNIAAFIGLFGGLCAGFAYTLVRVLGQKNIASSLIVLVFCIISILFCLPIAVLNWQAMSFNQVLMLTLAGIMATIAQFSITAAYRFAPAKELSVFDYFQIIFAAVIGYFVFNQLPDIYSFIGYFMVIFMALIMFLYENGYLRKNKKII